MDEFSPEQRVMIEVMRATGQPDPEAVVRADPVTAALFGSHLAPVLERMAAVAVDAVESYMRLERQMRKARRERLIGWSIGLVVSLILWWGIIAALRWVV